MQDAAQVMVAGAVAYPAAILEPCCRYLQVAISDPADRIITQGRALVRAVEALGTIEPAGPPGASAISRVGRLP